MGTWIKYALVIKASDERERRHIKAKFDAIREPLEEQGDFLFTESEFKEGWDSPVVKVIQNVSDKYVFSDSIVALAYTEVDMDGRIGREEVMESLGYLNQMVEWEDPGNWVIVHGHLARVWEVHGIDHRYVDLDSGTICNGPIARVPVNRLTEGMSDREVIEVSTTYREWSV